MSADLIPAAETTTIRVDDVVVGKRARRDYGDLTDLMESIRQHGVLQPIGLIGERDLLFGGRRLEACRRLGRQTVPYVRTRTRDDAVSRLLAERDENTCRKDMTPEELVDLGLRIEELEAPKAKARQAEGLKRGTSLPLGPDGPNGDAHAPRTAEVVGDALGMSRSTYKRAKHVVQTARDEGEDSDVRAEAQQQVEAMNAGTSTITGAYEKVRATREVPPPPQPKAPPKFGGNRKKDADKIRTAINEQLAGVCMGLDEIQSLDSTLTSEEAARLAGDLSRQIRSLNRIKKLLTQERTA